MLLETKYFETKKLRPIKPPFAVSNMLSSTYLSYKKKDNRVATKPATLKSPGI